MRQEQETSDFIGAALRRTFPPPGRTDGTFDDLLRRIADREAYAASEGLAHTT